MATVYVVTHGTYWESSDVAAVHATSEGAQRLVDSIKGVDWKPTSTRDEVPGVKVITAWDNGDEWVQVGEMEVQP